MENWLLTCFLLFLIIMVRYLLIAGLAYWLLWLRPEVTWARKLFSKSPPKGMVAKEIGWSLLTSAIYAVPGAYMLESWKQGGTAIYMVLAPSDLIYLPASVFLFLFLHDTYFYWSHRLMHLPKLYPIFHKVHHQSKPPTPWAAFSFHPYETLLGAAVIPLMAWFIPIHVSGLVFILTLMTIASVLNHCGYEVLPDRVLRGFIGEHCITAAHHNLHHSRFNCNYALYFRFWDKIMSTDVWDKYYEESQ